MRANRKSDCAQRNANLPIGGFLKFGATLLAFAAVGARAGDAPPPAPPAAVAEVPWETIEAWASGAVSEPGKSLEPAKKPDAKPAESKPAPDAKTPAPVTQASPAPEPRPAWTPAHPGERRLEPPLISNLRQLFMARCAAPLDHADKSHDYERAWQLYFQSERYQGAGQELLNMKADKKHYPGRELWYKEHWIATGLMIPSQPHQEIDVLFKEWKDLSTVKANQENDDLAKHQELDNIALMEEMLNLKPSVPEFIAKHELAGDADPAALWELCQHLAHGHPYVPLHYMAALLKLREWYPGFDPVKSGDVQWRLVCTLGDLDLNKEAADEAHLLCDNFSSTPSVASGDALWTECERRRMQGENDAASKKEQIDLFRVARDKYKDFVAKYPNNGHNRITSPGQKKTDAQTHLDDLSPKLH